VTSTDAHGDCEVPERWRIGSSRVPKERYTSPDFLALEHARLFPRVWQMACREEEIAEPGCFYDYRIGRESVLVVRQRDGSIRAFHNACPHRGMQLARGSGHVEEFRCPFHGWRYDLDGRNSFVFMPDEFEPACRDLAPVAADTWGGWIFVHLGAAPEPLESWLEPVVSRLAAFRLADMRYAWRKSVALHANWKTVVDAFIEGYHTAGTHPESFLLDPGVPSFERAASRQEYDLAPYMPTFTYELHGWCGGGRRPDLDPNDQRYKQRRDDVALFARSIEYLVENVTAQFTERDARAARALVGQDLGDTRPVVAFQEERRALARTEGVNTYPDMSFREFARGVGAWHIFPTMVILPEQSCLLGYRMRPHSSDPNRSIWDVYSLEHFASGHVPTTTWEHFDNWQDAGLPYLLQQDMRNLGGVQAGMQSSGFFGLQLNTKQETTILHHHEVADRYLFGSGHQIADSESPA